MHFRRLCMPQRHYITWVIITAHGLRPMHVLSDGGLQGWCCHVMRAVPVHQA